MALLVTEFIGQDQSLWDQPTEARKFLVQFAHAIDAEITVGLVADQYLATERYTVHLAVGGNRATVDVSREELVDCNSRRRAVSELSQEALAERFRTALGVSNNTAGAHDPEVVLTELARLRSSGVALRNQGERLGEEEDVDRWITECSTWRLRVEHEIARLSPSEAQVFETLDRMPALPFPMALNQQHLLHLRAMEEYVKRLLTLIRRYQELGRQGYTTVPAIGTADIPEQTSTTYVSSGTRVLSELTRGDLESPLTHEPPRGAGHTFISYSRQDQAYARRLADWLRGRGIEPWLDDRIDFGDRWWKTIVKAIKECAAFLVVMTPESDQSEWVEKEVLLALKENKLIIPLLVRGQAFPLLIGTQPVDVTKGQMPPHGLIDRLGRKPSEERPLAGGSSSTVTQAEPTTAQRPASSGYQPPLGTRLDPRMGTTTTFVPPRTIDTPLTEEDETEYEQLQTQEEFQTAFREMHARYLSSLSASLSSIGPNTPRELRIAAKNMRLVHGHLDNIGLKNSQQRGELFANQPCYRCGKPRYGAG